MQVDARLAGVGRRGQTASAPTISSLSPPPESLDALKQLIASRAIRFPARIEVIARHALADPAAMAFESTRAIAERTGASQASVVRFARLLGFGSFAELRELFRSHLRQARGG